MKRLFVVLILVVCVQYLYSQGRYTGLTISTPSFADFSGGLDETRLSFNIGCVGFYHDIQLNRRFWLQPEIGFSRLGPRYADSDKLIKDRQNLLYIKAPLLLNTYFSYHGFFQTGPFYSFLRYASLRTHFVDEFVHFITIGVVPGGDKNLEIFNKHDFGWIFGIGFGTGDVAISFRYYLGLADITKLDSEKVFNRSAELTFAVSFRSIFADSYND